MDLTDQELRILGCLVEKEAATPDHYPLTTNALVAACNQKSSREPVVDYDERAVDATVLQLRERGLAGPGRRHQQGCGSTMEHSGVGCSSWI